MAFKYDLGARVTHREMLDSFDMGLMEEEIRQELAEEREIGAEVLSSTVLERRLQECKGGIRMDYLCPFRSEKGFQGQWFRESELVPYPMEKMVALMRRLLQEEKAPRDPNA